jgi:hypothetical protein
LPYLVFCNDIVFVTSNPTTGRIMCTLTLDAGTTWHCRRPMGGTGSGWDSDSKFDTFPIYAEGAY